MSIPTLYLDFLILASSVYPSGFSYSLFTLTRRNARVITTAFLALLVLPYLLVALGVWFARPELLIFRGANALLLLLALFTALLALIIEYGIHAAAVYATTGRVPGTITVQRFWQRGLTSKDHLLLLLIAVGEEILYRMIWFGVLHYSFQLPVGAAVAISSLAYGLNHLAFGFVSVVSKTITGAIYCLLYLLGGQSVLLPILAHAVQNVVLFQLTKERHA